MTEGNLEAQAINVMRGLAMDGPNAANSGHQGTAMALAPLAHVLFTRIMNYDAAAPSWPDRDRFVLSAGHASILQYSFLHACGFGLSMDDLKDFRQWDSATPGHPEAGHTDGVEVTTGPLGQGFGNGVGMALAERTLRTRLGEDVCNHFTYVICGDGDLAEGVSHEAASLAGHQGLGKLIAIYDDNHVSIDGPTELALSDDAPARFAAYGWHVIDLGEKAEDLDAMETAIRDAQAVTDQPSIIVLRSHIGYPSPSLTDSPGAHGLAFGEAEITEAKTAMGLPDTPFYMPDDVLAMYRAAGTRGSAAHADWQGRVDAVNGDRTDLDAWIDGTSTELPFEPPNFDVGDKIATRVSSNTVLKAAAAAMPSLIAGAADLTGNTGVKLADNTGISAENPGASQLYYGVREHGMGAIMNGMALHGGVLPVGGTFLVFSDYMRGAVRLAALSGAKVIYSFTHDSVGVGEDGPTHQPVEHVAALRAIPDLRVIRPGDANEVAAAWQAAVAGDGPTALILSRQGVPTLEGTAGAPVSKGGYVLVAAENPAVVLIGTGSELSLCVDAAATLANDGIAAQVVSLPSWDMFKAESADYRASVIPPGVPSVSIEAGVTMGWHQFADAPIGIDRFGASAPGGTVLANLGMTVDNVVATAKSLLR